MPYEPYVTPDYYKDTYRGEILPDDECEKYLAQSSRHIDTLTFNRIVGRGGISALTGFQQQIIRNVVCKQAEFEFDNSEVFNMILKGYSINGMSMQFRESWNVITRGGIPMRRDVYGNLCQTGLCERTLR